MDDQTIEFTRPACVGEPTTASVCLFPCSPKACSVNIHLSRYLQAGLPDVAAFVKQQWK